MGLFSGSTKTTITVATQAVRVIPNDKLPNSRVSGALTGIRKDQSIVDNVMNRLADSIALRAGVFYAIANKKYVFGMPSGKFLTLAKGHDAISTALASELKIPESDISIEYAYLMPKNLYHQAWTDLVALYEYDPTTNKLGKLSKELKQDVFLDDLQLYIKDSVQQKEKYEFSVIEAWGRPASSGYSPGKFYETDGYKFRPSSEALISDVVVDDAHFQVMYSYKPIANDPNNSVLTPKIVSGQFALPAQIHLYKSVPDAEGKESNKELVTDYYQIKYRIKDKTSFITKDSTFLSKTIKNVEDAFTIPKTEAGHFFPFVYFRWDHQNMADSPNTPEYKDSERILQTLGLNYEDMCYNIHYKDVEEETGKTAKEKDLDPNSKTYNQLIDVKEKQPVRLKNQNTGQSYVKKERTDGPGGQLQDIKSVFLFIAVPAKTQEPVEIKYLIDFFIEWSGHPSNTTELDIRTNQIGNNTLSRGINKSIQGVENYSSIVIQDKRFKMALQHQGISVTQQFSIKTKDTKEYSSKVEGSVHSYTWQNSDFTSITVTVTGLKMTYYNGSGISAGYTDVADDVTNLDRKHLLIPIDKVITDSYSMSDRELLYSRGLHLIYNTEKITVTKIPWYATGFFKIFIMIIVLIITIVVMYFCPPAGVVLAGSLLAAGATMAAVVVIVEMIIEAVIMAVILHFVLKAVAKLLGPTGALILGVVAMVAAVAMGGIAMMQELPALSSAIMSDALLLMSVATGLISAAGNELQHKMKGLEDEAKAFESIMNKKTDELDAAKALLEDSSHLLSPFIIPGESADAYYNRTSHMSNPGVACFDVLDSFCDILLTLPTLNTTVNF